ncbi:TMEM175 family protein [Mucilaginibacter sp.]|uniref:TMEM175 family protein n=1 Tax=Mucilaginibacter sp. TaxID=1882438 RepID=UPI003264D052
MLNHDLKKEFQVERIAFFSDAVFAIAITLLIIEIKVPELHGEHFKDSDLARSLGHLIPKFIGFIVSFFVIGSYWAHHHVLFKYVEHYSPKLVWNNMFLLFSIVLMPFSSAFYSEYWIYLSSVSLGFYVINISLTGFLHYRLWAIVSDPKNHLSVGLENPAVASYYKTRAIVTPVVFLLCFLVSLKNMMLAYWVPATIFIFMMFVSKYYRKHHPEIFVKQHNPSK